MHTVRVYLKSGRCFDIEANTVRCKHNTITGELVSLSYEGATAGIPPIRMHIIRVSRMVAPR